jgi:hypothetical protein
MMNASNPKKAEWRKAVNDNCKNCIYDSAESGTWRQQVERCTVTSCALYPIRPVTETYQEVSRK